MSEANFHQESSNCKSIDVYIFRNGQQNSPPRKYHLHSDELNMWETTLANLAQSQYGSGYLHIELFTLEGKKVQGPLELANEKAYVAVKPSDVFIKAGYEKYLLRASRSWEKRQDKLKAAQEKSVAIVDGKSKSGNIKKVVEKGICKMKNNTLTKSAPSKVLEKFNVPIDTNRKTIEKKNELKAKINVLKNNSVNNSLNSGRYSSMNNSSIKTPNKFTRNALSKKNDQNNQPEVNIILINDAVPETQIDQTCKCAVTNDSTKDDPSQKINTSEIINEIVDQNVYNNRNSETPSAFVDAENNSSECKTVENMLNKITEEPNAIEFSEDQTNSQVMKVHKEPKQLSLHDVKEPKTHISCTTLIDQNSNENGHVITLNLNIKLKDYRKDTISFNKEKNNMSNCEKESQTNVEVSIEENLFSMNKQLETKSENRSCICPLTDLELTKVIVIRCLCNGSREESKNFSDDQNIVIPNSAIVNEANTSLGKQISTSDKYQNEQVVKYGASQERSITEPPNDEKFTSKKVETIANEIDQRKQSISLNNNHENSTLKTGQIITKVDEITKQLTQNADIENCTSNNMTDDAHRQKSATLVLETCHAFAQTDWSHTIY
ncbi:unnamed protein product [Leptidea sinapis]|uniref:Doublecortin domain-containing protein n=1 Tax=Leptidea sinapis TaxID=189913 RepID=A0A5E4Q448_9NEOP|nr:unnamed protein product [Leptidea sinapis]